MCFIKRFESIEEVQNAIDNPLIAEEDILVHKALNRTGTIDDPYKSPFLGSVYHKGQTYRSDLTPFLEAINHVGLEDSYFLVVNVGLHAYINKDAASIYYQDSQIHEMIIPKGSKYYTEGFAAEIVSNTLIFKSKES